MNGISIGAIALVITSALAAPASAAVVGLTPNVDLSNGDYTFAIGEAASYTFGVSDQAGRFFGFPVSSVTTGGTATVASLGLPFFDPPQPSTYFTEEGRRPTFDALTLGIYQGYASPSKIEAEFDSYIGLKFTLADGDHFGFARVAGLFLSEIAYETVAGQAIQAGPGPYGALPEAPAPVPLPASLPLLAAGLALFGLLRRRAQA